MRATLFAPLVLVFAISAILVAPALAVSPTMAVQGMLRNPLGGLMSGVYNVTFRLYDVNESGVALATIGPQAVVSTNGLFTTLIDVSGLAFDKDYWLEVQIAPDAPMTPRQRLTPAPYALALPGLVSVNGSIGIGTANPAAKLHIYDSGSPEFLISGNQPKITLSGSQNNWTIFTGVGATVGGALLISDSTTNHLIINALGNVGIGTVAPAAKLSVNGTVQLIPQTGMACDTSIEGGIYYDSDNKHFYGCNGTSWIKLDTTYS